MKDSSFLIYLFICFFVCQDGLEENRFNEYDNISFDQSILNNSRTPLTREVTNLSFMDENLSDEDAWMCILDVVNAEVWISI